MIANPRQRVWAAGIDIALMLGWATLVAGALTIVSLVGLPIRFGPFGYNLFVMGLVVLPATVALTALEAGRYEATPGKHRVGLRVRRDPSGERVGWGRSLARNLLKLGLPWSLAQSAALAVATSPTIDAALGVLMAAIVPLVYLVTLFWWGRTVYDWLTGTMVISVAAGRRFADPTSRDQPTGHDGEATDAVPSV